MLHYASATDPYWAEDLARRNSFKWMVGVRRGVLGSAWRTVKRNKIFIGFVCGVLLFYWFAISGDSLTHGKTGADTAPDNVAGGAGAGGGAKERKKVKKAVAAEVVPTRRPRSRPSYHLPDSRIKFLNSLLQKLIAKKERPPDEKYNVNITLAETISVNREVVDARMPQCKEWRDDVAGSYALPAVTVVIPFHNEPMNMLIRCVHSILNRTPPHLLAGIILVDDASTNPDIAGESLEEYIKELPKTKLVRSEERIGLIRTRMLGSSEVKSPVVVYLDGHTEVNQDWYEPLAELLLRDHKAVIQPVVDDIDPDTIQYAGEGIPETLRGGFAWDLRYVWTELSPSNAVLANEAKPFPSSTLVGCAVAVWRETFLQMGGFDEGMDVWGAENIETAFRAWQCGGSVKTVPCSRVGHLFKKNAMFTYGFGIGKDKETVVSKNVMRTAELWMGPHYKRNFYSVLRAWDYKQIELTEEEQQSIVDRRRFLLDNFQCKSFDWYLKHVVGNWNEIPEDAHVFGEVFNENTEQCLTVFDDGYIGMHSLCYRHRLYPDFDFYINSHGQFKHHHFDDRCILPLENGLLHLGECENSPDWRVHDDWQQGQIRYSHGDGTELCLMHVTNIADEEHNEMQMPQAVECSDENTYQQWHFTYRVDFAQADFDGLHSVRRNDENDAMGRADIPPHEEHDPDHEEAGEEHPTAVEEKHPHPAEEKHSTAAIGHADET